VFLSLPDASLYTIAFGSPSAPPILTLSGWIGSWEDWADTLSVLSERWRAISFDHRGSGATIAPVESITFDTLVDDVFAVLDAYRVERCVLAAMSMGTAIAFGAALRHPERFSGLVVVNGFYQRAAPPDTDPFLLGLRHDYARTLDRFAQLCTPEPDSEPVRRWGRQILDRASQQAAIALYTMPLDMRVHLPSINLPALVVHGDADPLVSVQAARQLAATLPNARLALIEGAGHVPIMTYPRRVADEIDNFFGTGA
jgi:pimeloyl-ACP methyl ester carboxylesterase